MRLPAPPPTTLTEKQFQAQVIELFSRLGWTHIYHTHDGPTFPGEVIIETTLDVNPTTKARARVVNGRAFTPAATKEAEEEIAWLLKAAGAKPNLYDDLRIELAFRTATAQRRDLDNLVKLVLDASNGVLWHDDVQVTKLEARVIRGHPNPGIDLRLTIDEPRPHDCETCGTALTTQQSRKGQQYCSNECYGKEQRQMRSSGERHTGPPTCRDCDAPLGDARSTRCRPCFKIHHATPELETVRSAAGFPDLVLVHPRLGIIYAELKSDTGKTSPEQDAWIDAINTAAKAMGLRGRPAIVWRPRDWDRIVDIARRGLRHIEP